MGWQPSHYAPRDRPVWLYVPAYSWETAAGGHAKAVVNAARVAQWDKAQGGWIDQKTGHAVYPSLWSDADPSGPMPDNPMIELQS